MSFDSNMDVFRTTIFDVAQDASQVAIAHEADDQRYRRPVCFHFCRLPFFLAFKPPHVFVRVCYYYLGIIIIEAFPAGLCFTFLFAFLFCIDLISLTCLLTFINVSLKCVKFINCGFFN